MPRTISPVTKAVAPLVALAALIAGSSYAYVASERTTGPCTVYGKAEIHRDDSTTMRVTTSCGTFVVADTLLPRLTFDAADRYGRLVEGRNYDLDVVGFRQPVLSTFPTILEAREVTA